MQMEIERGDVLEETETVDIPERCQWRNLLGACDQRWAEPILIVHGNVEGFHQRTRILPKALLARDKRVAVMEIFHLTLFKIGRKADIVVGGQNEASVFASKPVSNGLDFFWLRVLLGSKVIEPEDQQSVGVGQCPFINWQSVARLIDSLENRHGVAGDVFGNLLEVERRPVKQFQRTGDPLEKLGRVIFRRLIDRPQRRGEPPS